MREMVGITARCSSPATYSAFMTDHGQLCVVRHRRDERGACLPRRLDPRSFHASGRVDDQHENVRAAVAAELEVIDSFLTGSYRRSTLITPL